MVLTQHCWLEKSQPQSAAIPLPEPDDVPVVMLPVPLDVPIVLDPLPDVVVIPLPLLPGFVPVVELDPPEVPLPLPEPDGSPFVPTVCPPHAAATAQSDQITLFASLMKASTRTKSAQPSLTSTVVVGGEKEDHSKRGARLLILSEIRVPSARWCRSARKLSFPSGHSGSYSSTGLSRCKRTRGHHCTSASGLLMSCTSLPPLMM
jgi:hypothetical protein